MSWKFSSEKPIFQQLVEIISSDIITGRYKTGEKLPTVRELAIQAGVNPNTMQRAFVEVEQLGLIYTKRGDGRYVGNDRQAVTQHTQQIIDKTTAEYLKKMSSLGLNADEIIKTIEKNLNSMDRGGEDGNS